MNNWIKRIKVYFIENGRVSHFGDGKDYILIKEFDRQWIPNKPGWFNYKDAEDYAEYLRNIGFKDIRTSGGEVLRYACKTSGSDMVYTNMMNGS